MTKFKTSMYHLTIDMVEQNISFNQLPLCHIPSMNVGSHGTTNPRRTKGIQRLNHLHPHQTVITPKPVL